MTVEHYYKELINVESSELYKRYISDDYVEEYRQACVKILAERGDFLNEENAYKIQLDKNVISEKSYNKKYNMITAFIEMFKKYNDFKGRSVRSEFWCGYIMHLLIIFVMVLLQKYVFMYSEEITAYTFIPTIIGIIYCLLSIEALNALIVRRLHDAGESGWFALLQLIPYIGIIVLFIFLAKDSQAEENKYGKKPNIGSEMYTKELNEVKNNENEQNREENIEIICPKIIKKENTSSEVNSLNNTVKQHINEKDIRDKITDETVDDMKNEENKSETSNEQVAFCRKCGTQLLNDSQFCHKCGCEKVR